MLVNIYPGHRFHPDHQAHCLWLAVLAADPFYQERNGIRPKARRFEGNACRLQEAGRRVARYADDIEAGALADYVYRPGV